jgi:uncharacterized protein
MKINEQKILYSPSDLNNFISCKYHIKNDLVAKELSLKKKEISADIKLWRKYGDEHEAKYLKLLQENNKPNITIDPKQSDQERFEATKDAIKKGFKLIYKAFFVDKNFRGECDFLIRLEQKSDLGEYSYEVYDTKITKNLRSKHVLQITGYSFLLSKVQGSMPLKMHLIDGSNITHDYKVSEFIDYFLYSKENFENFLPLAKKENLYPEKCSFCPLCPWLDECEKKWTTDNYINQTCGIVNSQVQKFKKEKIKTVSDLAKIDPSKIKSKINLSTKIRLVNQAKLQELKKLTGETKAVFLNAELNKGFYKMPEPNEGDLFYDIEGFPQSDSRPFEYLHGVYYLNKTKKIFKNFAVKKYNTEEEKRIFIELIDFFKDHFKKYPDAYLYHYNNYEKRALKDLSISYSSVFPEGQNFIDSLLRQEKFVDLYLVVSQCMQTTEKDLSLKTIEIFYRKQRSSIVKTADDSIKLFDNWCSTNESSLIQDIINYNEEDCISTYELREFLLKNRSKDLPWFSQTHEDKEKNSALKDFEINENLLIEKLESKKNKNNIKFIDDLISLVGFHRREAKPSIWAYYERKEKSPEELEDDADCIGNCVLIEEVPCDDENRKRYKYKFNTQNYKIKEGNSASDIFEERNFGKVESIDEVDDDENYVEISISKKILEKDVGSMPINLNLGPPASPNTNVIASALNKFIQSYLDKGTPKYKCADDLLKKNHPDIPSFISGKSIIDYQKDIIEESIKVIKNLNSSYILIQGPPGSGKTYASAKIILSLLKDGKKVGVTSNSHKAINNLLEKIEENAEADKFIFKGFKKASKKEDKFEGNNIKDLDLHTKPKDCLLYAGTVWLFSDARLDQKLDYIFIDEAGQVSLANTLAIATSTKNLVLIGDQMQLSQPIQGIHVGNSGKSSLDFLLEGQDTIPADQGIFLNKTRRLNNKICSYISSSFYDFRLKPHPVTETRSVDLKLNNIGNEGIFYLPMDHKDCTQKSDEEVEIIEDLFKKIKGKDSTDEGKKKKITNEDIMIVAPFNMQVNNFKRKFKTDNLRVGTIDKFQGQESKVVFVSMTSSDPENLPRHKEFFFSRNRLNVAISRGQCVAVILFNPNLLLANCKKINEMRLVNNFCKLLQYRY